MTRDELLDLKARHTQLKKWKRQAQGYSEKYGKHGSVETRHKHAMQVATADIELPLIEEKLRRAWE